MHEKGPSVDIPESFTDYFNNFLENCPSLEERLQAAWQLSQGSGQHEAEHLPFDQQGYNLLLGNWGSNDRQLETLYRHFYKIKRQAVTTRHGETVVITAPEPGAKVADILESPDHNPFDSSGPHRILRGRIADGHVYFTYRSSARGSGKKSPEGLPPPYLVTQAGITLDEPELIEFDFTRMQRYSSGEQEVLTLMHLGSTLNNAPGAYQKHHVAHVSRMLTGARAAEYVDDLKQQYVIE